MSVALIAALYSLALAGVWAVAQLNLDPTVSFSIKLVVSVLALVGPIFVFGFIDHRLVRRAVKRIGVARCTQEGTTFLRTELHKNHFALVYESGGEKRRAKFRVRFYPTTWFVRHVLWL